MFTAALFRNTKTGNNQMFSNEEMNKQTVIHTMEYYFEVKRLMNFKGIMLNKEGGLKKLHCDFIYLTFYKSQDSSMKI